MSDQARPIRQREEVLTGRYSSDGIYAAQAKRYTKFLQRYDRMLIAKWLWDRQRWSIWTRDRKGLAYLVYVVETPAGHGFRRIGPIDLVMIAQMDQARKAEGYSMLKEIEEHNARLEETQGNKIRADIRDLISERWRTMKGHPMIPVGISFQ